MKKKVYLDLKVKSIISVLVILGIILYAAPIKAADTKDVVAGLIIGGIIGSEIEKANERAGTTVIYPNNPRVPYGHNSVREYRYYEKVPNAITYCRMPMDTIYVPDKRNFDPRRDPLYLGEWHWSAHEQAWIRDTRQK